MLEKRNYPATSTGFGCKSPNYSFPFTNPIPPPNELSYANAVKFLKETVYLLPGGIPFNITRETTEIPELPKTPFSTVKAVFAVMLAEANKNEARTAFISSGGHNYAGVQTDGARWGAPGITGQYCRVDSGSVKRAFAIFPNDTEFLKFMISRVEAKGFNGDNGNEWTNTYIQSWWSPKEKAQYTVGTPTFKSKLSIYNTAMRIWNSFL